MLAQAKLSLYKYLTKKYGDLKYNKHRWIKALERMMEFTDIMPIIQAEAVRQMLKELKYTRKGKKK
jgi:hypothetical protein